MSVKHVCHILIRGRVQGVGFRYWLAGEAGDRGLTGWARNRRDGTVEAMVCGDEQAVTDIIAACSLGPRFASVSDVELLGNAGEVGDGFEILPTV